MSDLMTADEVNAFLDRDDGDKLLDKYFSEAVQSVNAMTCGALTPETTGSVSCSVADDGLTVKLPKWFSQVSSVSDSSGRQLEFTFTPSVYDISPHDGEDPKYGNELRLKTKAENEAIMTVSGIYGFNAIPSTLKHLIAGLMGAYDGRQSGEDAIKSKSIEDVSVTSDTKTGQTPEQVVMDSQSGTVDKWSLCDDKYRLGTLAYPDKRPSYPYYVNPADLGGGSNVSIGSVG